MDQKDPANKIVELMKHGRPTRPQRNLKKKDQLQLESSKIEIQGSGNIVLIGGESADLFKRVAELEQTLQALLTTRQQSSI